MPLDRKSTVTLCMIVRNEERNLRDCLQPVAALFDEMVIVDTGSTDRTREIAGEFTSQVHDYPWTDDFAAARNQTLDHATGDWIFWLDADDRLAAGEIAKLRQLLQGLGTQKQAYLITTVCRPQFECEGAQHLLHYRLFRRDPLLRWKGRVHEQLRPEPLALGYEVCSHDLQIEHLGYAEPSQQLKKAQRDLRLLRMDFATDPEDVSTTLHLALAYARVSNFREAKTYLEMLSNREATREDWQRGVYQLLAEISMKLGDFPGALQHANTGLSLFPDDVDLLYLRAQVLYETDAYPACVETLLQLRAAPEQKRLFSMSLGDIRTKWAPLLLADAWREQGKPRQAAVLLESVLAAHPTDVRILYSLGLSYLRSGQRGQLPALRQRLEPLPQGEVFALLLFVTEGLMFHAMDNLAEALDRLISKAPQMPKPRILRLEYLSRIHAPPEARLAACRDALRLCPGDPLLRQRLADLEKAAGHSPVAPGPL